MKIYIINLARSPDRKIAMQNEIQKLSNNFEVHFFNAIDAKANEHIPFKEKYFSKLTKYLRGKNLSDGEIACFASHYCLWEECIKLNKPIIILEDDIIIQPHFDEGIKNIIASGYNFVKLASTFINAKNKQKTNHYINEHFIISHKGVDGSQGYYITPIIATAFIKHSIKWHKPVDNYMESFWIHNVPTITYNPQLIEDNTNYNTTIEQKTTKTPLIYKLTREISRLLLNIRKKITELMGIFQADFF